MSAGSNNNGTGALNSAVNLQQTVPSSLGMGGASSSGAAAGGNGNLRAKWTRAISGPDVGGVPQSPTSNSYRHNKTNNVSI